MHDCMTALHCRAPLFGHRQQIEPLEADCRRRALRAASDRGDYLPASKFE
jgi:hypothetical protein